jgi:hypothetical protein
MALPAMLAPAHAEPLQARIQHTETMPSVSPELRSGSRFNLNITSEAANNRWVRIPNWLAGTWIVDNETTVSRQDCVTGQTSYASTYFKAKSRFTYGDQCDREGGIWHYLGVPYCSATDFPGFTEYHQVSSKEFVENTPQRVSIKTQFAVVRVSKTTRQVIETLQQESITTYSFANVDQLDMTSSTKVFDELGAARNIACNQAVVGRAEPFTQIDRDGNKDLHQLFRQFLLANNLQKLLPD